MDTLSEQETSAMYFFDVQYRMYFVPLMIVLSIVAADAVDSNATTHFWWRQLDWVNYLANYEGTGAFEIFNQPET